MCAFKKGLLLALLCLAFCRSLFADTNGSPFQCGGTVSTVEGFVEEIVTYAPQGQQVQFGPIQNPYANLSLIPTNVFATFGAARFNLKANASGTYYISIPWAISSLSPDSGSSNNSGSCNYTVIVRPKSGSSGGDGGTNGTAGNFSSSGIEGDPVNMFTGEFTSLLKLFNGGGPMAFNFSIYYASRLGSGGDLGPNWKHNFETRLFRLNEFADLVTWLGEHIHFQKFGTNWVLLGGIVPYQLKESAFNTYLLLDPRDGRLTTFDSQGRMSTMEDGKGNAITLYHDSYDKLTTVSDNFGRTFTFTYSGTKLQQVELSYYGYSLTIQFIYNPSGALTKILNPIGQATSFGYDPTDPTLALLTTRTNPLGNVVLTQAYDAFQRVVSQSRFGGSWTLTYTNYPTFSNSVTTMIDPKGYARRYKHDHLGQLIEVTDEANQTATFDYDAFGRRVGIHDRLGDVTVFTYNGDDLASVTEADGSTTSFIYSPRILVLGGGFNSVTFNDLTQVILPDGTTRQYSYDAYGNLESAVDTKGQSNVWTYDTSGLPLSKTSPIGGSTQYSYSYGDRLSGVQTPDGNFTQFAFDNPLFLPSQIYWPDTASRSYTYDTLGRIVAVYDENNDSSTYTYDGNGRCTRVIDREGQATKFGYDTYDQLTTVTNPLGQVTRYTYDNMGQLVSVINLLGETVSYSYDALGRLAGTTNPVAAVASYTYDAEGQLVQKIDPLGNPTTYQYDSMGRLTRRTNPEGASQQVVLDSLGRVIQHFDELVHPQVFTYDENGRLILRQSPTGAKSSFTYDANGNLLSVTNPLGDSQHAEYDTGNHVVTFTDSLGRTRTFALDVRGRVAEQTWPSGRTGAYEYDPVGRVAGRSYTQAVNKIQIKLNFTRTGQLLNGDNLSVQGMQSSSNNFSAQYDAAGRMVTNNGAFVFRDASGRVTQFTLSPAKSVKYTYGPDGRVNTVSNWSGGVTMLQHDSAGRLTGIDRPNNVKIRLYFTPTGRINNLVESNNADALTFQIVIRNASGRIIGRTNTGSVLPAPTFSSQVSVLNYTGGVQVASFDYDGDGLLMNDAVSSYSYDAAGRCVTISNVLESQVFTYDALGDLVSRNVNGVQHDYVWTFFFGRPQLTSETIDGLTYYYIYTPDGLPLFVVNPDGSRRFFHFDISGNLSFLTDDSGAVTDTFFCSPTGEFTSHTGAQPVPFVWQALNQFLWLGGNLFMTPSGIYDAATQRVLPPLDEPLTYVACTSSEAVSPQLAFNINLVSPDDLDDATFRQEILQERHRRAKAYRKRKERSRMISRSRHETPDEKTVTSVDARFAAVADKSPDLDPFNPTYVPSDFSRNEFFVSTVDSSGASSGSSFIVVWNSEPDPNDPFNPPLSSANEPFLVNPVATLGPAESLYPSSDFIVVWEPETPKGKLPEGKHVLSVVPNDSYTVGEAYLAAPVSHF